MENKANKCTTADGNLLCRQVASYVIEHNKDLVTKGAFLVVSFVIGRITSKKEKKSTFKFAPVNIKIGNFPKLKR